MSARPTLPVSQDACDLAQYLRREVANRCGPAAAAAAADPLHADFNDRPWRDAECHTYRAAVRVLEADASLASCACTTVNHKGGPQPAGAFASVVSGTTSAQATCAHQLRIP